jgi:tripartite-type tricarboxylate transporter receptor subunit TctC
MDMARLARWSFLTTAVCVGLAFGSQAARSDPYPSKPIVFVTPGTPGSTSDIMPRVIGAELAPLLGKPVVIENRSGGSGLISANAALSQPPDGHTIWLGTMGTLTINPNVMTKMPFDPLKAWTAVALVASMPLVLVVNPEKTAVRDLAGLIELAKKHPGTITFGSAGIGSSYAITMFLLGKQAGVEFTHVPYKGTAPAVSDVLAGELTAMVPDVGLVKSQIDAGKLRALAVTPSKRVDMLPNVPTFKELGYNIDISLWYGVFVRSETPGPIIQKLSDDLRIVMKSPNVNERWGMLSLEVGDKFGDDFESYYRSEYRRWAEILKPLGIRTDN